MIEEQEISPEVIKEVIKDIRRVSKNVNSKTALAFHVYIHAMMHKEDSTAVVAGLMASKYVDANDLSMHSPADCALAVLITVHGFEAIIEWTDAELEKALAEVREDDVVKAAKEYLVETEATVKDLEDADALFLGPQGKVH